MLKAKNIQEAWEMVNQIFPTDYEKDEASSQRAGYPIYRSTAEGRYYDYICDLNDRLEINLADGNRAINIWIESEPEKEEISAEKIEKLKSTATRIQKLGFWFAGEMLDEEDRGRQNREQYEKEKAENPDKLVVMVDASENNVRCMKECLKSCRRSYQHICKNKGDIEEWQIAGINAMFDQANKEGIVPYDLPYAIEGILLILEPEK